MTKMQDIIKYIKIGIKWSIKYNLLPYKEISIKSTLSKKTISTILNHNIEDANSGTHRLNRNSIKIYEGQVHEDSFWCKRILKSGINSFIPIANGNIIAKDNGIKIDIKFHFHKFVNIMMIIFALWMSWVTYVRYDYEPQSLISGTYVEQQELKNTLKQVLDPHEIDQLFGYRAQSNFPWTSFAMIFIPYAISMLLFRIEIEGIKDDLKYMLTSPIDS